MVMGKSKYIFLFYFNTNWLGVYNYGLYYIIEIRMIEDSWEVRLSPTPSRHWPGPINGQYWLNNYIWVVIDMTTHPIIWRQKSLFHYLIHRQTLRNTHPMRPDMRVYIIFYTYSFSIQLIFCVFGFLYFEKHFKSCGFSCFVFEVFSFNFHRRDDDDDYQQDPVLSRLKWMIYI